MSQSSRSSHKLPVIDVSALRSANPDDYRQTAVEIDHACRQFGFFYVSGHGTQPTLIRDVWAMTRSFFDLPEEVRQRLSIRHSTAGRGYEGIGTQALGASGNPDFKESFYLGLEPDPKRPPEMRAYGEGPNQWPEEIQGFKSVMQRYIAEMQGLAARLMRGIGMALNLPPTYFDPFLTDPLARLRLLHYPPSADRQAPLNGAGAHTDFGGLTLLLQDENGGLQVWDQGSGDWIDADPIPDTFVVNLGDLIARWTNEAYRSTQHRVLNVSGRRRYSVPFFMHGNVDYVVNCIPSCVQPQNPPRYPPVTVGEHYRERFARSRAERRT
jgi:isopenicillin N synthase-like dioxygenase